MDAQDIYSAVTQRYSALSSGPAKASGAYGKSVAQAFGYTEEELCSIPTESNLGLSCGNPLAIASLREGETIIDLGSGGGFDVFLAAKRVGPTGRAIGVDMNKDMLALAEKNKEKAGATNVDFVESRITRISLADGISDVVISNCVINLIPEGEKQLVFDEMFRLLKPGGRVAVSDILAKKPLPEELRKSAAAYVACVGGASLVSQYQTYLEQAGFVDVLIKDANSDLNVYFDTMADGTKRASGGDKQALTSVCCSPGLGGGRCEPPKPKAGSCCGPADKPTAQVVDDLDLARLGNIDVNEWVGSFKVFAVKPDA